MSKQSLRNLRSSDETKKGRERLRGRHGGPTGSPREKWHTRAQKKIKGKKNETRGDFQNDDPRIPFTDPIRQHIEGEKN